jgi:hypothetical protein
MTELRHCDQCGNEFEVGRQKDQRFCTSPCRRQWHREHDPEGIVRGVRRLTNGRVGMTIWFEEHDAERALHMHVNQKVVVGGVE